MKEIWKDIPEYEKLYQASDYGNIKAYLREGSHGKILKPEKIKFGYLRVCLCKNKTRKRYLVHRLVLETFVGPCPPGMECRHLNGIRTDNRLCNLKWDTRQNNIDDQIKHGTRFNKARGSKHGNAKLVELNIPKIKKLHEQGLSQRKIAKIFNVTQRVIWGIINDNSWKHVNRGNK